MGNKGLNCCSSCNCPTKVARLKIDIEKSQRRSIIKTNKKFINQQLITNETSAEGETHKPQKNIQTQSNESIRNATNGNNSPTNNPNSTIINDNKSIVKIQFEDNCNDWNSDKSDKLLTSLQSFISNNFEKDEHIIKISIRTHQQTATNESTKQMENKHELLNNEKKEFELQQQNDKRKVLQLQQQKTQLEPAEKLDIENKLMSQQPHAQKRIYVKLKQELECDVNKCKALTRCVEIMIKYNEWLDNYDLCDKNKLLKLECIDYNKYNKHINQVISTNDHESMLFITDVNHIKQVHHYAFGKITNYIRDNYSEKDAKCSNHNCFSIKCFYLSNKNEPSIGSNLLYYLANLHIFLYHSMYISSFKIEEMHPRDVYLVICYIENKQRKYENRNGFMIEIIHLISIYYGGKFIGEDDAFVNTVSPLGLAEFIDQTMDKNYLNRIWSKLDPDGSDTIDITEVDGFLLVIAILCIAYENKQSGNLKALEIYKEEIKDLIAPIGEWMKKYKMIKQHVITKEEFKDTCCKWLKEYHKTNGGIITDNDMEKVMLNKYKANNDYKISYDIPDRLIVNCQYLIVNDTQ